MMPFLQSTCYAAGWSRDIDTRPVGRTILDKQVGLFRIENAAAAALREACPHRFAPLSLGCVRR